MKSKLSILLLLCFFTLMLMTGCGLPKNEVNKSNTNLEERIVEIAEWPENRFTDNIIKPSFGIADYVIDDSDNGKYAVFYSDISMEEAGKYIEGLKDLGYHSVLDKKEDVAIGVVLKKDNVILSISASEGGLGIYISIE